MDFQKLQDFLKARQEPRFRFGQIAGAIGRQGKASFLEIETIPLALRKILAKEFKVLSFTVEKIIEAKDKRTYKALFKLADGNLLESVFMAPKPGEWSACLSCQVGCAMHCAFCATGEMGLKRNLTTEEITDQVLFWRQFFVKMKSTEDPPMGETKQSREYKESDGIASARQGGPRNDTKSVNFTHLVFMGMGEPFHNWPAVKQSLRDLLNPELFGFGSRGIAVSTSGLTPIIPEFVKEFPQVNLAISLHFATDEKRSRYMPVNKAFSLEVLKKTLQDYFEVSRRKVFIEYVMLKDINDSQEDAEQLALYLKSIGPIHLLHLNLIPYHAAGGDFASSPLAVIQSFGDYLRSHGFRVTVRRSLGLDIGGACGQLGKEKTIFSLPEILSGGLAG